jgi:hypothetical protein
MSAKILSAKMSVKILPAVVVGLLLGSTAFASAQTIANPRYWGGGGYYGPGTPNVPPSQPGAYFNYAPGAPDFVNGPAEQRSRHDRAGRHRNAGER